MNENEDQKTTSKEAISVICITIGKILETIDVILQSQDKLNANLIELTKEVEKIKNERK